MENTFKMIEGTGEHCELWGLTDRSQVVTHPCFAGLGADKGKGRVPRAVTAAMVFRLYCCEESFGKQRGIHHFAKLLPCHLVKGSVFLVTQARVVFGDRMRHLKKANLMPA